MLWLSAMQLGWMFDMWRKDKDGRDKLQTLKGHVDVPSAATDTAAIIERVVSQLVINAQTYKVPELSCWMVFSNPCCILMASSRSPPHAGLQAILHDWWCAASDCGSELEPKR